MGEDITSDKHSSYIRSGKWVDRTGLRNRWGNEDADDDEGSELVWEMCRQSASYEQLDKGCVDGDNVKGNECRSFVEVLGQTAAFCIGVTAFLFSAPLLIIAYTAACCVIVGKDFTESSVGQFVFGQSPYWEQALRGPLELLLDGFEAVASNVALCWSWVMLCIFTMLHGLRFALVEGPLLLHNSSVSASLRGPWTSFLMQTCLWTFLFATGIQALELGYAYWSNRHHSGGAHARGDGVERESLRAGEHSCSRLAALHRTAGTFIMNLGGVTSGSMSDDECDSEDFRVRGYRRMGSGNPASGAHSDETGRFVETGSAGTAAGEGEEEIDERATRRKRVVEGFKGDLSPTCDDGLLNIATVVLRNILPTRVVLTMVQLVGQSSLTSTSVDCGVHQSKDLIAGRKDMEVELPAISSRSPDWVATEADGNSAPATPCAERGFPDTVNEGSSPNENPRELSEGSLPSDDADGDNDWCMVASGHIEKSTDLS